MSDQEAPKPLKRVWVDLGDERFPMSVIDAHPKIWKDKISGVSVAPQYRERFKEFVEVLKEFPPEDKK